MQKKGAPIFWLNYNYEAPLFPSKLISFSSWLFSWVSCIHIRSPSLPPLVKNITFTANLFATSTRIPLASHSSWP